MSSTDARLSLLETGFEGYPSEYVQHNVPLIVLSGLGNAATDKKATSKLPLVYRDGALRIHGDLPPVTGPIADELLSTFHAFERRDDQWDAKPVVEGSNVMGFKFRITGRVRHNLMYSASLPKLMCTRHTTYHRGKPNHPHKNKATIHQPRPPTLDRPLYGSSIHPSHH